MILHVKPHNSLFHNHMQSGKMFVDKDSDSTKLHSLYTVCLLILCNLMYNHSLQYTT